MSRVIGRLPDCLDLRGLGVGAIESFSVHWRILRHAQEPEASTAGGAWQGVSVKKQSQAIKFSHHWQNNRAFRSAYKPLPRFD